MTGLTRTSGPIWIPEFHGEIQSVFIALLGREIHCNPDESFLFYVRITIHYVEA
jgi:hypothetical protein